MRFRLRHYQTTESHLGICLDMILTDQETAGYYHQGNKELHSRVVADLLWVNGVVGVVIRPYEIILEKGLAFEWGDILNRVLRVLQMQLDPESEMVETGLPVYWNQNPLNGATNEWVGTEERELVSFLPLVDSFAKVE